MKQSIYVAMVFAAVAAAFICTGCAKPQVVFFDDFSGYGEGGAKLEDNWSSFSGHWYVQDGTLHQDQGSFDYGTVIKDLYLRCDYTIETKVRLVGGGAGAGLYWNIFNQVTGDSGNMLRYDGNRPIMYGWMTGRYFFGTGGATGNLTVDGKWHTLRMDVRNSDGTFDLYWDGKQIADGAKMYHRSGYVGLECSLGHCEFDDVKVTVPAGVDWRVAPQGKVDPEWVSSVAILPNGDIVYPVRNMHKIQIVTPDGKLVTEFGRFGEAPGQLNAPSAVAVGGDGLIYVAEYGNNRVQVFDATGKSIRVIAPAGENALKNPLGVAVEGNGRLWVSDSGNNRIVCLNNDGAIAAVIGKQGGEPGQFNLPWNISFIEGRLYVADSNNFRIQVFDPNNVAAAPEVHPMGIYNTPHSVAYDGNLFLVCNGRYLQTFDKQWQPVKTFSGTYADGVQAEQVAVDKNGNYIVADAWNKRIVTLHPKLTEVDPKVSDITQTGATITWTSDIPTPTKILVTDSNVGVTMPASVDYSKAMQFGDGKLETEHKVVLTGLKPATRHVYAIVSPTQTIPAGGNSRDYRFFTEAQEGMMAYLEVPVAVLCYGNVTFESQKRPDGTVPAPVIRDEAWFEGPACKAAADAVRYFYLKNSRYRFDTKFYYYFVKRPVDFAYLGSSSEEVYRDLKTVADREGMKPEDFGGVITIGGNGTYAYPWPTPWWGGKLTYTTGVCFCGGGGEWLICHEFHHVTEGWMYQCGTPGYDGVHGYNCADVPWGHPGRFGENEDFLAHTLKFMPPHAYLNCPFGKIRLTADKDGDGVPDDEPSLIWDEKRAGTDPNNKFSYDNGLTDLQNLTADNFGTAVRGHKHPLLTKEIDFKYPFAIFSYDYERHKKTPTIDGAFAAGEWDEFAETPNAVTPTIDNPILQKIRTPVEGADYRMKTYLNWDDENLYIAVRAPYKFLAAMQIDCNADGYFHGKDNVCTGFEIPRDDNAAKPNTLMPPPGVMVWNNVEPVPLTGYPGWTNELFNNREKIRWAWGKDAEGWYVMEIALPKTEAVGLVPAVGKEMGIRFWCQGYLPPTESNKDPRYSFEMFDVCEYGQFKLAE